MPGLVPGILFWGWISLLQRSISHTARFVALYCDVAIVRVSPKEFLLPVWTCSPNSHAPPDQTIFTLSSGRAPSATLSSGCRVRRLASPLNGCAVALTSPGAFRHLEGSDGSAITKRSRSGFRPHSATGEDAGISCPWWPRGDCRALMRSAPSTVCVLPSQSSRRAFENGARSHRG